MSERPINHEVIVPNADCYLSVRIANSQRAFEIQAALKARGIKVNNPCDIDLVNTSPEDMPVEVSKTCYAMMDNSASTVVVYSEAVTGGKRIGRDCAAEIGYTVGSGKPIFVLVDEGTLNSARQRLIDDLPIHHHDILENHIFDDIESLSSLLKDNALSA